jgi:SAM-dependent methyltransferase
MFDCTTEKYDVLYDRWLDKPGELLDWAKFKPKQHRLLDLCGGTGAVTKEALKRGAEKVTILDLYPRVDKTDMRIERIFSRAEELRGGPRVPYNPLSCDEEIYVPVGHTLPDRRGCAPWNLVICRQALGYLDLPVVARRLHEVIEPGGRFVFNTFIKPKWSFKTYRRTSSAWTRRYWEASCYFGRTVFHLQAMDGDFDISRFHWHTETDILDAFKSGWAVMDYKRTASTLWYSFERLGRADFGVL